MTEWYIVAGVVALVMAFAAGQVRRMPLSASIVYLSIGYLIGPYGLKILEIDPSTHSQAIRIVTEGVIVVSIFSSALKLRVPYKDFRWLEPLRLAFVSMILGTAGMALVGHFILGWSWGAAFLLGAILSPTDPVLASDVEVDRPYNVDPLRFSLTGEAGMNDGTAFPLVTLGLALVGVQPLDGTVMPWVLKNVVWGFLGAVLIGTLLGYLGGRTMLNLRLKYHQRLGTDNFLALGLMGLSYGLANLIHVIGFVSVFAAGIALRRVEHRSQEDPPEVIEVRVGETAPDREASIKPENVPVLMMLRLQTFAESLEQIGAAIVVIILGSLIRHSMITGAALILGPILFFVIRPVSVLLGSIGSRLGQVERGLIAWFGIRGMASVYYLAYIHEQGASVPFVRELAQTVVGVVAFSILLHGTTVTPLMSWFEKHREKV